MELIEDILSGGHPNSLGRTVEVVDRILADPTKFDELYQCYFSNDEVVRLRVSNAMKRICKEQEALLVPYIDRFIDEISTIDQASTQWTLAQLFLELQGYLNDSQLLQAKEILKKNLQSSNDWIVLNMTMQTLSEWSREDVQLKEWILPILKKRSGDSRKSVSGRAKKLINLVSK